MIATVLVTIVCHGLNFTLTLRQDGVDADPNPKCMQTVFSYSWKKHDNSDIGRVSFSPNIEDFVLERRTIFEIDQTHLRFDRVQ